MNLFLKYNNSIHLSSYSLKIPLLIYRLLKVFLTLLIVPSSPLTLIQSFPLQLLNQILWLLSQNHYQASVNNQKNKILQFNLGKSVQIKHKHKIKCHGLYSHLAESKYGFKVLNITQRLLFALSSKLQNYKRYIWKAVYCWKQYFIAFLLVFISSKSIQK